MDGAIPFYEAHVESDVAHERIALNEMVGGLLDDEPTLSCDVVFGARALDLLERRFAERLLGAWSLGQSSLRCRPLRSARGASAMSSPSFSS